MRNRILTLGILFLLVFSAIIPMSLGYNVKNSNNLEQPSTIGRGKTLYVGGTGPNNYTRIRDAINDAVDGDTVFVYNDSAPYFEILKIKKSINLIGEDRYTTLIDASESAEHAILITADNVKVSGFKVGNLIGGAYGIYINSNNSLVYENNVDWRLGPNGIAIHGNSNVVKGNYLKAGDCGFGISLINSYYNTIEDNYIHGFHQGMRLEKCTSGYPNLIINNTIEHQRAYGIFFWNECSYIEITKNHISYCLSESPPGKAIVIRWGSHNNSIHKNIISNNKIGIQCEKNSNNNKIYHNNFINNEKNGFDEADNYWDNGGIGNYWDDYEEKYPNAKPKLFKSWIWNTPYEIPGGSNKDMYPLVEEWPYSKPRTISRNRAINTPFQWFLQQHLNLFPILRLLLQR